LIIKSSTYVTDGREDVQKIPGKTIQPVGYGRSTGQI